MKEKLEKYKIILKIYLVANLKIVFQHIDNDADKKVLVLKDVVGFIENPMFENSINSLIINKEGGSYNLDLSIRLQKPEIIHFSEVFIFADKDCINFSFRAVAKNITFRDWSEKDQWLP